MKTKKPRKTSTKMEVFNSSSLEDQKLIIILTKLFVSTVDIVLDTLHENNLENFSLRELKEVAVHFKLI